MKVLPDEVWPYARISSCLKFILSRPRLVLFGEPFFEDGKNENANFRKIHSVISWFLSWFGSKVYSEPGLSAKILSKRCLKSSPRYLISRVFEDKIAWAVELGEFYSEPNSGTTTILWVSDSRSGLILTATMIFGVL